MGKHHFRDDQFVRIDGDPFDEYGVEGVFDTIFGIFASQDDEVVNGANALKGYDLIAQGDERGLAEILLEGGLVFNEFGTDVLAFPVFAYPSFMEKDEPIGKTLEDWHVMGGDEDRFPLRPLFDDLSLYLFYDQGVKSIEGFI